MPKVSQAHRDARRRQILDAAVACFAREGFHRTTMQEIIAESKLSAGAIYNYFTSKDQIIAAIANDRHMHERAAIREAQRATSVGDALAHVRDAFFGHLDDARERRRRRVSIQLWAEAQRDPRIHRLVRRGIDRPRALLQALIARGQRRHEIPRELDPDATARFMIAAFHGFVLQLDWDPHAAVVPYRTVLDTCLQRLLAQPLREARPRGGTKNPTQDSAHGVHPSRTTS
ncbi:MAG TPA: TetR/AcrR family transcriptional regulator [Candidatus Binatia bacterium]|nr:TetR/AcrR family transcriptional regulator [Candidatus Binatia bacterium]